MNWLKKGPELKLSELKVPDFLYDLFYDLKDRHLLPLVAVLIVAMVGAPIYFNNTHESEVEPSAPVPPATASTVAAGGPNGTITVAHSEPGLRDYRRRLKDYRALDPFRQQGGQSATAAEAEEVPSSTPVAPVEATVIGEEATPPAPEPSYEVPAYEPPTAPVAESAPTPNPGTTVRTRYVSSAIDVRVVTVPSHSTEQRKSKRPKPKAEVRRNLPELTMLPARKTPAATYIGLSNDGKKALFVVSSNVVSIFGEAKCLVGSQSCQLLMLEPQMPVTFVYGPQERTYRIELLKIDRTYSAKPRRAALGKTAGGHRPKAGEGEGPSGEEPAERGNG